jgi:hypothetical protein
MINKEDKYFYPEDIIKDLAIDEICPISHTPTTPYEVHAIENLISFGLRILDYLKKNDFYNNGY